MQTNEHSNAFPELGLDNLGLSKLEYAAVSILTGIMANRDLQLVLSNEGRSYSDVAVHEAKNLFIALAEDIEKSSD